MIVSWSRGFNGGYNQLFFIQYRTDDTEEWTTAGPVNDVLEKKLKYTLYDLISNTQYHVCMFSRNTIGDSNTTNVTVTNTFGEYITVVNYNCLIYNHTTSYF